MFVGINLMMRIFYTLGKFADSSLISFYKQKYHVLELNNFNIRLFCFIKSEYYLKHQWLQSHYHFCGEKPKLNLIQGLVPPEQISHTLDLASDLFLLSGHTNPFILFCY